MINLILFLASVCDVKCSRTFILFISNHILFFKNKINSYDIYLSTINTSQKLTIDQFDYFININFEVEQTNKSIIQIIYESIKNLKQYKFLMKDFELHLNNINIYKNISLSNSKYKSVLGLFSNYGDLIIPIINNNISYNNIELYDNCQLNNEIANLNLLLSYNINLKNSIKQADIISDNVINEHYDLIICSIIDNFKNIIYANCNNIIKKLKIRGTKVEPLLLQYVLQLVKKSGDIVFITPTSLLFGESNQHIETRKYLIENFNLTKIVEFENKKSILYISNNRNISTIEIQKNGQTFNVPYNDINKTNYNLYFNNISIESNINIHKKNKISEYINILTKAEYNNIDYDKKLLYVKNFNIIHIDKYNDNEYIDYFIVTKNEDVLKQEFINIYLSCYLNKYIDLVTKGKMKKICKDLVNELEIEIPSIDNQDLVIREYNINSSTISNNNDQINNYINLKTMFIKNIILDKEKVKITDIFNITNTITDQSVITIKKNSLSVGSVELIQDKTLFENNTNYYYLNISDNSYNIYYHILKIYEGYLYEESIKTKTIGLSKQTLDKIELPILPESIKEHLIHVVNYFDDNINFLININNELKNKSTINLLC
jgi:hypothetical protein